MPVSKSKRWDVDKVCEEIRVLHRQRVVTVKRRIMQQNGLRAVVATFLGYEAKLDPATRKKMFDEADAVIEEVKGGKSSLPFARVVDGSLAGVAALEELEKDLAKQMVKWVPQLPACRWVEQKEQLGFGLLTFAQVVGECGNLAPGKDSPGYSTPSKFCRRMGLAPWNYKGESHMGAEWRSGKHGALPAAQWEEYGYSPRRRSISWNIGECLIKLNYLAGGDDGDRLAGPYRAHYLWAKEDFLARHPGVSGGHCANHGRLVATKLLLRNLWTVWNKGEGAIQWPVYPARKPAKLETGKGKPAKSGARAARPAARVK